MPRDKDAPLSLDWALIESWKESGIPLEAVLAGIAAPSKSTTHASESTAWSMPWRYCTQEVLRAAEEAQLR